MTEATEIKIIIRENDRGQRKVAGIFGLKGSMPLGTMQRIQSAVSEELAHNPSGRGGLEQRTELLRRLIAANGGHEQGESWADAVDRIIESRRHYAAARDDQQRSTKEVLATALAALQSCDGNTDPTDDNFADTSDWSVARFAGEVRHAAQCLAERTYHKQGVAKPRSPYDRLIVQRGTGVSMYADVYEILAAYETGSTALDHLVKKALAPGQRHAKDRAKDLEEIEWSATCARMENEVAKEKGSPEGDPVSLKEKRRSVFGRPEVVVPFGGRAESIDSRVLREAAKTMNFRAVEASIVNALEQTFGFSPSFGGTVTGRFSGSTATPYSSLKEAMLGCSPWLINPVKDGPEEPKKERFWAEILERVGTQRIGDFYVDPPGEKCRVWSEGFLAGRVKAEPEEVENLFSAIIADDGYVVATGLTSMEWGAWRDIFDKIDMGAAAFVSEKTSAAVVGVNPNRVKVDAARQYGTPIVMWGEVVEWIKWRAALEQGNDK